MSETYWDAELDRAVGRYWTARNRRLSSTRHAAEIPVENLFDWDNECAPPAQTDGALPPPECTGREPVKRSRTVPATRDNSGEAA